MKIKKNNNFNVYHSLKPFKQLNIIVNTTKLMCLVGIITKEAFERKYERLQTNPNNINLNLRSIS